MQNLMDSETMCFGIFALKRAQRGDKPSSERSAFKAISDKEKFGGTKASVVLRVRSEA